MGSWVSHYALMNDCVFPKDVYAFCIKFNKMGLKSDEYIEVLADHNWLIPLVDTQQIEVDEEIRINGTMIVTLIS